jgi:hypothetical protein
MPLLSVILEKRSTAVKSAKMIYKPAGQPRVGVKKEPQGYTATGVVKVLLQGQGKLVRVSLA